LSTSKGFSGGQRPFIYQEVIDQGGEPITADEYFGVGRVTEFKYGIQIGNNRNAIQHLETFGESWGLMPDGSALVFLNNHDNQRGHGGGGSIITFEDPYDLKIFNAFMMAWPYGVPRIMSSYYFDNSDQGPPSSQRSINEDGSCGNGWVCEHRWRQITNMVPFAAAVDGQGVSNWWTNGDNQIAFSRGNKGFLAINKAGYTLSESLQTGLPSGSYCDVISGNFGDSGCSGQCISVDGSGYANINIPQSDDPMIALHVNAPCNCDSGDCGGSSSGGSSSGGSGGSTNPPSNVECSSCNSCTVKNDCGFMGINQLECEGKGCMWCPSYENSSDPWCIEVFGETSGGDGSPSCNVDDGSKQDCGFMGIDQAGCESEGCCWAESNGYNVPWCFFPA